MHLKTVSRTTTTVALLLLAAVAHAESPQEMLNRGNKLFGQGDYQAAYAVYQEGYKASPKTPVFLRSMGFSLLKLYQHERARETLQRYLKEFPRAPDRKNIEDLVGGLEVVIQTRISVVSEPSGAELYIDTEAGGKVGNTPFQGTIDPGKHTVLLRLPGYAVTTRTFTVSPKQSLSLKVGMEVPLEVTSSPPGAAVHLESDTAPSLGVTPLSASILPGKRTLVLKLAGYKTFSKTLEVPAKTTARLDARLSLGLRLVSVPAGARVLVDGRAITGATPVEVEITPGKHTVTIQLEGYKPHVQEVEIAAGQDNALNATLRGGLLTMRTSLEGAKVTVGSHAIGQTPVERASVPLGTQVVKVEHPHRRSWSHALDFEEDQLVNAKVKLGAPIWPVWVAAGATVVGVVMAAVGGGMAIKQRNELDGKCDGTNPVPPYNESCSYAWHHVGTAGWVVGGTGLASGLLYYLLWGRPSVEIQRGPATQTAAHKGN